MTTVKTGQIVLVSPSEDLLRLEAGEISRQDYLNARVDEALEHVRGRVSRTRLATVKNIVTEKLRTDPVLLDAQERLFTRSGKSKKRD